MKRKTKTAGARRKARAQPAKTAARPFEFVAASYLIRIRQERAHNLAELARFLKTCSDESIFYHTFQSLETHHYSVFSSDFAQWVQAACNELALAEQLASLDLRGVVSLAELRNQLVDIVDAHLAANPQAAGRPAFEPFHFCEAVEVTVPLTRRAHTLKELAAGIRRLGQHTLTYHFIASRLRLKLETNDFSFWIKHNLGRPQLAAELDAIDFYTNTLDSVRAEVLRALKSAGAR